MLRRLNRRKTRRDRGYPRSCDLGTLRPVLSSFDLLPFVCRPDPALLVFPSLLFSVTFSTVALRGSESKGTGLRMSQFKNPFITRSPSAGRSPLTMISESRSLDPDWESKQTETHYITFRIRGCVERVRVFGLTRQRFFPFLLRTTKGLFFGSGGFGRHPSSERC